MQIINGDYPQEGIRSFHLSSDYWDKGFGFIKKQKVVPISQRLTIIALVAENVFLYAQ